MELYATQFVIPMTLAIAGSAVGALVGVSVGYLLRRVRRSWRYAFYLAAIVISVIPYVLHYSDTLGYLARSGVEQYPGLDQYTSAFLVVVSVAILGALLIARFRPAVAAFTPVALVVVYWYFVVPLLYLGAPDPSAHLDNVPLVWLFAHSVAACMFLLAVSLLALAPWGQASTDGGKVAPSKANK